LFVTPTTQRHQVTEALTTEPVVLAMVEVAVAKRPTSSAGGTGRFDPEDGDEGVTPVRSKVQP
jgi:hypothetical protein